MLSAHSNIRPDTSNLSPSQPSKPISISLSSRSNAPSLDAKPNPQNPKKRHHSSLADESDSDHERTSHGPQLVSAFDNSAGGAIGINGVEKSKAPLVIPAQKNRDWRGESRRKRGKNLLPAEVQASRGGYVTDGKDVADEATPAFGLTFVTKDEEKGDVRMGNPEENAAGLALAQVESRVKTEDEEAMEALMGDRKKNSDLIVSMVNGTSDADDGILAGRNNGISEDDAFRLDIASRPDSASLDDYAAIPVEEFGAALLRGMGWKDDAVTPAKKARAVERRPALLGVGAKEVPGGLDELGAWGKAAKGKRKADKTYNPVLLRNSQTGEMLTEEELKEKQEERKRQEDEGRERKERNLAADEKKKEERRRGDGRGRENGRRGDYEERESKRRKERERERERESERKRGDERRERSRSPPRRRDKRRGRERDRRRGRKDEQGHDSHRHERRREEVY